MSLLGTFVRRLFGPKTARMPAVGSVAPPFDVLDQDGRRVRLADFRGRRVVLWFYPKADTPG
jgi:peroxiredoxin Q/BCP